jgi:hypothetical protein
MRAECRAAQILAGFLFCTGREVKSVGIDASVETIDAVDAGESVDTVGDCTGDLDRRSWSLSDC